MGQDMTDLRFLPAVRIAVALEAQSATLAADDREGRRAFVDGVYAGLRLAGYPKTALDMPRRLRAAYAAHREIVRAHLSVARFIFFLGCDIRRQRRRVAA
jgi:hypothetical protein